MPNKKNVSTIELSNLFKKFKVKKKEKAHPSRFQFVLNVPLEEEGSNVEHITTSEVLAEVNTIIINNHRNFDNHKEYG